jgi:hypothetical protein
VRPERYIAALEQLERRQAAAEYTARASAIGYDPDELPKDKLAGQWWALLEKLFLNFHPAPSEDTIDLAVQALEAAERPAAKK